MLTPKVLSIRGSKPLVKFTGSVHPAKHTIEKLNDFFLIFLNKIFCGNAIEKGIPQEKTASQDMSENI